MIVKKSSPKNKRLQKNFIWNLIGSSLYSFTSLVFLIVVTRINGIDEAGIFTFAFSNACVFQIIGTYAGRSYHVTEKKRSFNDSVYFYNRIISVIVMVMLGLAFAMIRGYTDIKLSVVFLLIVYKALDAVAEIMYGIMQKQDRLDQVGISLLLKAVIGVIAFGVVDYFTKSIVFSSLALVITNLIIMICYDYFAIKKLGFTIGKSDWKRVLRLFGSGFFAFIFALLAQYLFSAPKYSIDTHSSESSQAIYGIISMPATVMILAANLLVHPFLLKIDEYVKNGDKKGLDRLILKLFGATTLFGLIATLAGALLGKPFFQLIYGVDVSEHILSLVFILIGGTAFGLSFIVSNVLTAMRKTAIQAGIYIVVSIIAFIASYALVSNLDVFGGCIAYLVSMVALLVIYMIVYQVKCDKYLKASYCDESILKSVKHTFVVLAYKESKYLESCIKSTLNQTLPTNVIIFTTTPNQRIKSLAKKYGLTLKIGKHSSIGGDFDAALNATHSDLVTIAHQDDIYDPEYAEQIAKSFLANQGKKVQIIFSDYYEIRGNNKTYHNTNLMIKRVLLTPLKIDFLSNKKWAKRFVLKFGNAISCPAVTFNMKAVHLPLFECDMICNVDWQAWEKLSNQKGSFIFINRPLMGHRIHAESETSKTIESDLRSKEDYVIYQRFWPKKIAKMLTKAYKNSEKSNNS